MKMLRNILAGLLVLSIATSVFAGDSIELRLKDGSRWRGHVNDQISLTVLEQGIQVKYVGKLIEAGEWHITFESTLAGKRQRKTVFKSDIVKIATDTSTPAPVTDINRKPTSRPGSARRETVAVSSQPGVFFLPLKGTVGETMRHEEMEKIAEEADRYGPGQIIVLLIDSPGGLVTEMETIHDTLTKIKKRHRLVAWIREAISAACATSLHCDEIYFMTEGSAGAMTAFAGGKSWQGDELKRWLQTAGDWAEQGGRSRYIAEAMIHAPKLVSYDRNEESGVVTWYADLSGEFNLSNEDDNLVFTSTDAVHSGFADGIADTEEELAKLLDLPAWHEKSDYGRKIAKDWQDTVERAKAELPKIRARLEFEGTGTGDPVVILSKQIKNLQKVIRWIDRAPNVAMMAGIPPKEVIERQIRQLRKELGDLKRRRRN